MKLFERCSDLYWSLTDKQRRKFNRLYGQPMAYRLFDLTVVEWCKITKDKRKEEEFIELLNDSKRAISGRGDDI